VPRTRIALVVGLAVAALAVAGCGGSDDEATATETETTLPATLPAEGSVLKGSDGPGFDISLSTEDGQAVETLAAGTYTLEVDDQSDAHNFHLTGTGVDVATDVGATGVESFEITVEPGTYEFVCDPHVSSMSGEFEVTG
jgi:hypothetical protein